MAYVYGHYTADTDELFYIGKGTGKRAWAKTRRSSHWNNITNKHGRTVKILIDNLTDEQAFNEEKRLIKEIGRNKLVNYLEGGQGLTSAEAKDMAQKRSTTKWKENQKLAGVRRAQNPEWQKKVTEVNKARAQDTDWLRRVREGVTRYWEHKNLMNS